MKKVKFEVLFNWRLIFLKEKPMQNNFLVFRELVFFDLGIPVSGFGFWFSVSGFRSFVSGILVFPDSWVALGCPGLPEISQNLHKVAIK